MIAQCKLRHAAAANTAGMTLLTVTWVRQGTQTSTAQFVSSSHHITLTWAAGDQHNQ
jgi:CTP:molybdopterin cytidylyltransferase MocA